MASRWAWVIAAHIEAWIDWNGDGDFEDMDEMVFDVTDSGANLYDRMEITTPKDAVTGQFVGLRIRISNQDNMTPYGTIGSGEVEDYLIQVNCSPSKCLPITFKVSK